LGEGGLLRGRSAQISNKGCDCQLLKRFNNYPRLAVDGKGRVWLCFRHRKRWRGQVGTDWQSYLVSYNGDRWEGPILVLFSDNLLDNRLALVPLKTGQLLIVYSSDGRRRYAPCRQREVNNALFAATIDMPASLPPCSPKGLLSRGR